MRRRSWVWLAGSAVFLLAVLAPYLVAWRTQPPGYSFSGFLVNPIDGFSYLAKMRQGMEGAWLFKLPYAAEPGPGALLFVYYLLLGHLQSFFGAPPLAVYHAARLAGAALMVAVAFAFYRTSLPEAARRWALALALIGSGLGWLGAGLGRLPIDLWVPEAIPFFSAFANAHFPLSSAAMLAAMTVMTGFPIRRGLRFGGSALAGLVLALVQPFAVVAVVAVAIVWGAWLRLRPLEAPHFAARDRLIAGLVFLGVTTPWLIYDVWVTRQHAALAAWSAQNLTPTPPLTDVILGFGLVLVLAVAAIFVTSARKTDGGRLLISWMVVGLVLAYLPFGLQRRMLLGVFFPMAGLAGLVLAALAASGVRKRWIAYALFILCLPSNFVVVGATLGGALTQEPDLVMTSSERDSYAWMADHLPAESLVLAGEVTGNRLPAFADVRVRYGHPFETPDAELERMWVESIYGGQVPNDHVLAELGDRSIDYVYVGPRELSLPASTNDLDWLERLVPVYQADGVSVYRVPSP